MPIKQPVGKLNIPFKFVSDIVLDCPWWWSSAAPLVDELSDWFADREWFAIQHVMVSAVDHNVMAARVKGGDEMLL